MPRISEPTVAEHRAVRERALLDAAHELLMETGKPPALAQVAQRVGMSRTSIYQYFASQSVLLRAMVGDVFPRWTQRIASAMEQAPTPADRLLVYAVANVSLVAEGAHAVGTALAAEAPGEELDEQASRMHREAQEPLVQTLKELDVEAPEDVAALIDSVVHGATLLLESGQELDAALRHVQVILGPLVREHGGRGVVS